MQKALFLDRDGVINIDYGYVYKKEQFVFIDGIFDFCHYFSNKEYLIFVITNQSGIANGYYTEEDFKILTEFMLKKFIENNINISKVCYCPYHENAKIKKYKKPSKDRKPGTGMIEKIKNEYNINLNKSFLIGDRITDIEAGISSGIGNYFYLKGKYKLDSKAKIFNNYYDIIRFIETNLSA